MVNWDNLFWIKIYGPVIWNMINWIQKINKVS